MHTQRKTGLNRGVAGTKVEGPWYEDQRLWTETSEETWGAEEFNIAYPQNNSMGMVTYIVQML
jgi:hypothetical protein